jgi:shikimate 5-dehydrogenase
MTVYDMVYRPTQLLADAKASGAQGYDGLGMLARQAMLAFQHWTGLTPPFELMRDALLDTM